MTKRWLCVCAAWKLTNVYAHLSQFHCSWTRRVVKIEFFYSSIDFWTKILFNLWWKFDGSMASLLSKTTYGLIIKYAPFDLVSAYAILSFFFTEYRFMIRNCRGCAEMSMDADHPYVPRDLKLPGYQPVFLSQSTILLVYGAASLLVVSLMWLVSGNPLTAST